MTKSKKKDALLKQQKRTGERLRQLRHNCGLTQEQVSKAVGIDRSLLSQCENGIRNLDVDSWIRLADLYEVSTDYICGTSSHKTFKGASSCDKLELKRLNPIGRHLLFSLYHVLMECPYTSTLTVKEEKSPSAKSSKR